MPLGARPGWFDPDLVQRAEFDPATSGAGQFDSQDVAYPAPAVPTVDGSIAQGSAGGATTATVTLSTTQGNEIIVAAVVANSGIDVSGVSDTAGLTWTKIATATCAPTFPNDIISAWWAKATSALSSDVITLSFTNGSSSFCVASAFGVIGADLTTPFADTPVTVNGQPADPISFTTSVNNELVLGFWRQAGDANPNPGSGFTGLGANFQLTEYQLLGTAGTISVVNGSVSGPGDSNAGIAAAIQPPVNTTRTGTQSATLLLPTKTETVNVRVTASQSKTLSAVSQTATVHVVDTGTQSKSLSAVTQTGTAKARDTATASQTLGVVTKTETGKAIDTGTQAKTLAAVTKAETGAVTVKGNETATLPPVSQTATGKVIGVVHATQSVTLALPAQIATGRVLSVIHATQNVSLALPAQSALATVTDRETEAVTLALPTQVAQGHVTVTGSEVATLLPAIPTPQAGQNAHLLLPILNQRGKVLSSASTVNYATADQHLLPVIAVEFIELPIIAMVPIIAEAKQILLPPDANQSGKVSGAITKQMLPPVIANASGHVISSGRAR